MIYPRKIHSAENIDNVKHRNSTLNYLNLRKFT